MEFLANLKALVRARVDFIVVGGVGAVLHGVPVVTFDLDVVHFRGRENRHRLAEALRSLDACYRDLLPNRVIPRADDLASPDHHMLVTRFSQLDLLGTIHGGLDYEDLVLRAPFVSIDEETQVRVLDLPGLIEIKEKTGRDKDLAQLPLLRRTLEEQRKREEDRKSQPGRETR